MLTVVVSQASPFVSAAKFAMNRFPYMEAELFTLLCIDTIASK